MRASRLGIAGVERALSLLGCLCLAGITICVATDVFLRYALSQPLDFSYDLVGT